MLKRESELRLSPEAQVRYDDVVDETFEDVAEEVQRRVLAEAGFDRSPRSLLMLRSALSVFKNDDEIQGIPFYNRFNRSKVGDLDIGSDVPDASLVSLDDGKSLTLSQYYEQRCAELGSAPVLPMVIVGGSFS